jgi:hypothetical protein
MDPQHLAIPNATVKLTSVTTAEERKALRSMGESAFQDPGHPAIRSV